MTSKGCIITKHVLDEARLKPILVVWLHAVGVLELLLEHLLSELVSAIPVTEARPVTVGRTPGPVALTATGSSRRTTE